MDSFQPSQLKTPLSNYPFLGRSTLALLLAAVAAGSQHWLALPPNHELLEHGLGLGTYHVLGL
eukprot:1514489-Karenia_brevis.AAC.1